MLLLLIVLLLVFGGRESTIGFAAARKRNEGRNRDDTVKSVKPRVTSAGGVLVVVVLYWAQAILVPLAT